MSGCIRGCICRKASSRSSPKEKAILAQPMLIADTDYIGIFESVKQRYKADVVVMKLSKDMQHRPSLLERDKRVRPKQNL